MPKVIKIIFVTLCFCISSVSAQAETNGFVHIETGDRTVTFKVEYAVTPEQKAKGLMHRKSLPQDHGMLFIYPSAQSVTMWMKDTPVSLDMIFINRRGYIRYIEKHTQPNSLRKINSGGKVSAVLEVPAGTSDHYGIKVGDKVRLGR